MCVKKTYERGVPFYGSSVDWVEFWLSCGFDNRFFCSIFISCLHFFMFELLLNIMCIVVPIALHFFKSRKYIWNHLKWKRLRIWHILFESQAARVDFKKKVLNFPFKESVGPLKTAKKKHGLKYLTLLPVTRLNGDRLQCRPIVALK